MPQIITTEIKEMSCFSCSLLWHKELAHEPEMNVLYMQNFHLPSSKLSILDHIVSDRE